VRGDLPLGVQAAQIAHAAGESGPALPGTYVVVLTIKDEDALRRLSQRLTHIPHVLITEPDLGDQAVALGALVANRKEIRKLTSSLPLFGKPRV